MRETEIDGDSHGLVISIKSASYVPFLVSKYAMLVEDFFIQCQAPNLGRGSLKVMFKLPSMCA